MNELFDEVQNTGNDFLEAVEVLVARLKNTPTIQERLFRILFPDQSLDSSQTTQELIDAVQNLLAQIKLIESGIQKQIKLRAQEDEEIEDPFAVAE